MKREKETKKRKKERKKARPLPCLIGWKVRFFVRLDVKVCGNMFIDGTVEVAQKLLFHGN